jgi:HPt (histidine-containing phosphotransfer) domain-containing protein
MFRKLLAFLLLPAEMSAFEVKYLRRVNRVGFIFFALHVPVFTAIAFFNDTNPMLALALSLGVLAGPALASRTFDNPRAISMVHGFTAMLMGGLLVHFGQGAVQIEMHFYFFALLAMLSVYANPMVIVTAAVTVALHHLAAWAVVPASVFNYTAPLWVVLVHAAFVVLESVAGCFIARSFFDNVIGLDHIVQARTAQLDLRNRDMRLVLDHVQQGFLTVDRELTMSSERSKVVDEWLGMTGEDKFTDYLANRAPRTAQAFAMGWEEVVADIMPLELTVAQLPSAFTIEERHYKLEYEPIMDGEQLEKLLIVISDVTSEVERERLELEQRDVMRILSRVSVDKAGLLEYFQEASDQVALIVEARGDATLQKRIIHTLKGNSMIFGVMSIATMCELFETRLNDGGALPNDAERKELNLRWQKLCESLEHLLGERKRQRIELEDTEYEDILAMVVRAAPQLQVEARIRSWRLEPTLKRLVRIGEQARGLAQRTHKGNIAIDIQDHQLRLDNAKWASFWSAFVHVVRNAVDHGLESEADRAELGKARGTLYLSTRLDRGDLVIELADDGRGVNWKRVAEKASERGLPHESRAELVNALFADGLSTLAEATEYSGRGVGMSAVRAACVERGGSVDVLDRQGGGTRVVFRFPASAESAPLLATA